MGRYVFRLPDVGEGTSQAEIVAWHVAEGDLVHEDQPIVDIMTDKATVEITSPVDGTVLSTVGVAGDVAAVGSTLLVLDVEGPGNPLAGVAQESARAALDSSDAQEGGPIRGVKAASAQARPPPPDMLGKGDYVFRLPDVGEGVVDAEIVAWRVKPGDEVEEDQPLVDVMTDKATVEITSPVVGRIVSLSGEPGATAAVGSILVVFSTGGMGARSPPAGPAGDAPAPTSEGAPDQPIRSFGLAAAAGSLAAPAVRRRATELGIDLASVSGSGPAGRILHQDLDAHVTSRTHAGAPAFRYAERAGVEEIRVIGLRRKIAERMQDSKSRIPHFAYVEEIDMTELERLRAHINGSDRNRAEAGRAKLTVLPFLIRALVAALRRHPQINATFDDDAGLLKRHQAVHLGLATQTPRGLMVPVIRHAEAYDLWGLALKITRVAAEARDGSASRDQLSGSTITLTSLGPLGGVAHTPVINAPEVAIIGPNKIIERPVVRDGQIVVRKMMNLSSSFDHRIVDGYDAAQFIQTLRGLLEHPATLFID